MSFTVFDKLGNRWSQSTNVHTTWITAKCTLSDHKQYVVGKRRKTDEEQKNMAEVCW